MTRWEQLLGDLGLAAGCTLIVVGTWALSPPAALIVCGVLCVIGILVWFIGTTRGEE